MVRFDTLSDTRFLSCLQDLDKHAQIEVLELLHDMAAQRYSWTQFVDMFGWRPLGLVGTDTFPGGVELHQFAIRGHLAQLYEVIGYTHENVVIICAVVRKATL